MPSISEPIIYGPYLTYQYNDAGEISSGYLKLVFDETVRERFKREVMGMHPNRPQVAWERFCELMSEHLQRLPDNEMVQREAWLCGVTDDGGPYVAGYYKLLAQYRAELAVEQAEAKAQEEKRAKLASEVSCRVIKRTVEHGEESDTGAEVEVTMKATGEKLRFDCRNIFDFGYVINPAYAVREGERPGEITNCDAAQHNRWYWMLYRDGQGWERIRDLTESEWMAVLYLSEFPPVQDQIRM